MSAASNPVTDELRQQIAVAIQRVRGKIRWKPGSAEVHLLKRRLRGHLPSEATVEDYERIIHGVVNDENAAVYVYWHSDTAYVAVVAVIQNHHWLVMFALDGIMESAFVVENPDSYLNRPEFEKLGSAGEVLT